MENKEKIKCSCGSYVLKSNFNRHLKSPKHHGKIIVKTYEPLDKKQCKCGKFISKANWARHLKSAQHIKAMNFFENNFKKDESKGNLEISKSPAKSPEKSLKYSLMAEIPAGMGRSEFFHLARKETEAAALAEKKEIFDVGADDDDIFEINGDSDNFEPPADKSADENENISDDEDSYENENTSDDEDSREKSKTKYTEEYYQKIIDKYKNMPKPLETTILDYLPKKESVKEAEINQPVKMNTDREIFQPGKLLTLFMKAEEIVRNMNFQASN
jgi:hypothetical protein